jgi:hypothetical protein
MVNINMAPKFAIHNKNTLEMVKECSCYYCFKVFSPSEIKEWVDKEQDTAICPYCGIDAVIPVYLPEDKDLMNLKKINEYWF